MYGPHLLLLTNFDLAPPSRGYSTDQSQFYRILLRDPLVGWVVQNNFSNKSCCPYMILASKIFLVAIGGLSGVQEAPDLPLAVAPTGTGSEHLGGQVGVQNQLPMHFLA